ncbi:MAG: pyruvate ferredoxin oxidoreductase subunit gamma [Candidatus Altiarchaeales archaeon]|nr:pyruvate ferredoxin oxidoreductase subunit gamma [Candidatus Altiarchaeales archaeon]
MKEVVFHGRGGQGAVTAATLLAIAAFKDGKFTQAFPRFGVERRGAPVQAFARISDQFIRRKSQVYEPDVIVVLDPTLFGVVDITEGLKKGGLVIINTNRDAGSFNIKDAVVKTVDVSSEALKILGRDIVNTAMLGAYAAITGDVALKSIVEAVKEQFKGSIAEKNVVLVEGVFKNAGGK